MHDLKAIIEAFNCPGAFLQGEPYGSGHINDTYAVTLKERDGQRRYILQRVNHNVFKTPSVVMNNIKRVTDHLQEKLRKNGSPDAARRCLTLIPTRDGMHYHLDDHGNTWRTYIFIENALTYDELTNPVQAFEAAKAFGLFQRDLADLPAPQLEETIPEFHHTRSRFNCLQQAIQVDACNRAATVKDAIAFAQEREGMVDNLLDLQACGAIPTITTHNDTKLNNVMLDNDSGEGICVIDLDTVMPGLSLYDFGDMVRTAMRPCPEDEQDLSKVIARLPMFEQITHGYLTATSDTLTPAERENLAFSARLITFEIGIRFLTDFLAGDTYFKTHRPGHNADRCNVQFAMVKSMEEQSDEMEAVVQNCLKTL